MVNLTKVQIDELKEKGLITQVVPSDDLVSKTVDGLKIEKYVTVTDPSADIEAAVTIPVTSISVDPTIMTLSCGTSGTITATVLPADATDKTVTWSIDGPEFATVQDGVVIANSNDETGAATITATAGDKSATCILTVISA